MKDVNIEPEKAIVIDEIKKNQVDHNRQIDRHFRDVMYSPKNPLLHFSTIHRFVLQR
jgi:hypothetical protein